MTTSETRQDEAAIRGIFEDRAKAIRAKDLDGVMTGQSPDILAFDVVNPLQYSGSDEVRTRAAEWFALYRSDIGYEIRDLYVSANDDLAFCHYLYRVTGKRTDGVDVDMWVRATSCLRRVDGAWQVTHEHESVPFDPESGMASLDLTP